MIFRVPSGSNDLELELLDDEQSAGLRLRLGAGQDGLDLLLVRRLEVFGGGKIRRVAGLLGAKPERDNGPPGRNRDQPMPGRCSPRRSFRVMRHEGSPFSLRLQNQFHHFAHRAAAARGARDQMRRRLRFGHAVGDGHSHARALQRAQIHDVVADETNLVPVCFSGARSFSTAATLLVRVLLLDEKINLELARPQAVAAEGRAETQPIFKPARRNSTRPRPSWMLNCLNSPPAPPMNTEPSVNTPSTSHRSSLMRFRRVASGGRRVTECVVRRALLVFLSRVTCHSSLSFHALENFQQLPQQRRHFCQRNHVRPVAERAVRVADGFR